VHRSIDTTKVYLQRNLPRSGLRSSPGCLIKKANLAFHTIAKIEAGATPNPTIGTV